MPDFVFPPAAKGAGKIDTTRFSSNWLIRPTARGRGMIPPPTRVYSSLEVIPPPARGEGAAHAPITDVLIPLIPDFQEAPSRLWIFEIDWPSATKRYGSIETDVLDQFVEGRIRGDIAFERSLADVFWGLTKTVDVSFTLVNGDGAISVDDCRAYGIGIRGMLYDLEADRVVNDYHGVLTQAFFDDASVEIHATDLDPQVFETLIPAGNAYAVDGTRWPKAVDLGAVIPWIWGQPDHVPLPYITDDPVNDVYEYMAGYGVVDLRRLYRARTATQQEIIPPLKTPVPVAVKTVQIPQVALEGEEIISQSVCDFAFASIGVDRMLMLVFNYAPDYVSPGGGSALSATFQGLPFTRIDSVQPPGPPFGATGPAAELWVLFQPPKEDGSINIVFDGPPFGSGTVTAVCINGAQQSMVAGDLSVVTAVNSASLAVPADPGDLSIATFTAAHPVNENIVPIRGTEVWNGNGWFWRYGDSAGEISGAGARQPGDPSGPLFEWTIPPPGAYAYVALGFRIQPAPNYEVLTDAYPGFTIIRTNVRQIDFSGNFMKIAGDLTAGTRNFADFALEVLSTPERGLALLCDGASFAAAAADFDAVGELYCDGAILERVQAQAVLTQLAVPRLAHYGLGPDGITMTVDTPEQPIAFSLAVGADVDGLHAAEKSGPRTWQTLQDRVSTATLNYRRDYLKSGFAFSIVRTVNDRGRPQSYDNDFIRHHRTADKMLSFVARTDKSEEDRLPTVCDNTARDLVEGQLVRVVYPRVGLAGVIRRARTVRVDIGTVGMDLVGWDLNNYIYTESTPYPPPNAEAASADDFSSIPPSPISSLQVIATGNYLDSSGTPHAWVRVQFSTPPLNYHHAVIRFRQQVQVVLGSGAGISLPKDWTPGTIAQQAGTDIQATLDGLSSGGLYDITVQAVNAFGLVSADDPVLQGIQAPGDLTIPEDPSGTVATVG